MANINDYEDVLRFLMATKRYLQDIDHELFQTFPTDIKLNVLRHTFASCHFMMNGGNILVLRDVLGHADISMTMRYAHFAPDHLTETIEKNPLAFL